MPYLISDITKVNPQSEYQYFFDANIWLAVLDNVYYRKEYKPYIDFFNKIIRETHVNDAKIAVPCLLLSEVLNRLISDIYYKEFLEINHEVHSRRYYKEVYRKSEQYKADLANATASIRDYHKKIQFVSDNLDQYSCKDLIKKIPVHLDINDYLYSKMALEQGLVIITNDADFNVEDVHIYTSQTKLLALMSSASNV